MRRLACHLKSVLAWAFLLPSLTVGLHGQDDTVEQDWLDILPVWDHSVVLRTSAGYKDNLLLSEFDREASGYISAGSDLTIWRLPVDQHQFYLLASGDYYRYRQSSELKDEATAVAVAQYKNQFNPNLEFSSLLQYSLIDQVIDVAAVQDSVVPTNVVFQIPVVLHTLGVRPALRHMSGDQWWLEIAVAAYRHMLREPLDDLWEGGPQLILGRQYGHRSEIRGAYKFMHRRYDEQKNLDLEGNVTDRPLRSNVHDWELVWDHYWDKARRWRLSTRLGYALNLDNGAGYYEYNRYQWRQQLRYHRGPWEFSAHARLIYYDYLHQKASAGTGQESAKTLVGATLRASWEFLENFHIFAEYDFERSLSNRDGDEYRVNKIGAGVDWEF